MNIGKLFFNIFFTVLFLFLAFVLLAQLVAEVEFNSAQKLADSYLWQKAEIKFKKSLSLDPFCAPHFAGYADFLKLIGLFLQNKASLLREPEEFYYQAYRLAPTNADYSLKLAGVKLKLFLKDKARYQKELKEALSYFNIAQKFDPNGFNVSYETGYWLVEAWHDLPEEYKQLAIGCLRHALSQKPWYWEHIYPLVWQNTDDFRVLERMAPGNLSGQEGLLSFLESSSLYQFRRRVADAIDLYTKKETPLKFLEKEKEKKAKIDAIKKSGRSDWHGRSRSGKSEYENGNMYWTGTMSAVIDVPKSATRLILRAKGSPSDNIYPYVIVELDGKEIGEAFVNNDDWKEYSFQLKAGEGLKVLSVTFCNDGGNAEKNEDRNLYIGEARIE